MHASTARLILSLAVWGAQIGPHASLANEPGLALTAVCRTESVGELAKLELSDTPLNLLGGRLTLHSPESAVLQPRPHGLMEAPASTEYESRVVLDAGKERMVVLAKELFALASDDFEKDVRTYLESFRAKYRVECLGVRGGLEVILFTPLDPPDGTRSDDSTFIKGAFLRSADRTIRSVDVFVNRAAEADLEGCGRLADKILRSVAAGDKSLNLTAGERRLEDPAKGWTILVDVPANVAVTTQHGIDFSVQRLIALGPLTGKQSSFGFYLGSYPNFNLTKPVLEGKLFEKPVAWQDFRDGSGIETLGELVIPGAGLGLLPGEAKDKPIDLKLKIHAWIVTPDEAKRDMLRNMADSMRLVKSKDDANF